MSASSNSPRGVIAAALGALLALGSLWLPWYTVRISDAFREMLGSIGTQKGAAAAPGSGAGTGGAEGLAGAFAGLFQGLASVMPEEITANGWTAMDGGDIAIAVAAGAMILVLLLASNGGSNMRVDRGAAGRLIALGGLVVVAVAAYHVVNTPGGGVEQLSGTVDREPGIFAAIAGGLMMLFGGLATAAGPRSLASAEPSAPAVPPSGEAVGAPPFAPPADPFAVTEAAHVSHADPFSIPEPAPSALPDPFASPAPIVARSAPPEPGTSASPDPFSSPEPVAAVDPFAAPSDAASNPSYAPLGTSVQDGSHVPDWSGFSEPEPGLTPARGSEPGAQTAELSDSSRPAGVSIPPPGWTGAA